MSGAEIRGFDGHELSGAVPHFAMSMSGALNHTVSFLPAGAQNLDLSNPTAQFVPDKLQMQRATQVRQGNLSNMPQPRMSGRYQVLRDAGRRTPSSPTAPRAPSTVASVEANADHMRRANISQRAISRYAGLMPSMPGAANGKPQPKPTLAAQPQIPQSRTVALGNNSPIVQGARMALRLASVAAPAPVAAVASGLEHLMGPKVTQANRPMPIRPNMRNAPWAGYFPNLVA